MKLQLLRVWCIALLLSGLASTAGAAVGAETDSGRLDYRLWALEEDGLSLTPETVAGRYQTAGALAADHVSRGISERALWLIAEFQNANTQDLSRRLVLENSWLDRVGVFLLHQDEVVRQWRLGDSLPFADREVKSRFLSVDVALPPGQTQVLWRIDTPDPKMVPLRITTPQADQQKTVLDGYYYGFLYGVIMALLLYNLLLAISLQGLPYLLYSVYTGAFLLANMSYTGHGFAWFWPENSVWQQWATPVWMTLYALCGFLFAGSFLQLRQTLPRANYYLLGICALMALAQALSLLAQRQDYAIWIAFSNVAIFSVGMIVLGVLAQRYGNPSARYFLVAIVIGASGAGITCFTVLGLLPYSWPAYHAVEFGMMLEAILLSLALAARLRGLEQGKLQAEKLALIDPLTELSNRRGFYERVAPVWQVALRNGRDMSVILMDVDCFKAVNDTYGHKAGDEVLKALARVLLEHSRSADLAVRWGGEEFLIFLPDTGLAEAIRVAQRYRDAVAQQRFEVGAAEPIQLTASFGVATKQRQQELLGDVISLADHNLYCAKQGGRDRVYPAPADLAQTAPAPVSPGY